MQLFSKKWLVNFNQLASHFFDSLRAAAGRGSPVMHLGDGRQPMPDGPAEKGVRPGCLPRLCYRRPPPRRFPPFFSRYRSSDSLLSEDCMNCFRRSSKSVGSFGA